MRCAIWALFPMLAGAQTIPPVPEVSAWFHTPALPTPAYRWLHLDPPYGLRVDVFGDPHLTLGNLITAGFGILATTDPATAKTTVSLDIGLIARQSLTVPVPGKCDIAAGAWPLAADIGHVYFCVPNADHSEYVWARVAVEINWDSIARCVQGAFGNVVCSEWPAPPTNAVYVTETDEVATPTASTTNTGWLLAYVPEFDLSCTRNGIQQTSGVEYASSGNQLISGIWQPSDVIKCSYRRRQ